MTTLNLVGAGRVGQTLARLWSQKGTFVVQDVLTTTLPSAQAAVAFIGEGAAVQALHSMRGADVWMLAVPDGQIAALAHALEHALEHRVTSTPSPTLGTLAQSATPVVFHCSGSQGAALLAPLAARGWHTASAHCILSFATPQTAMDQFAGTVCALEGHATACATLRLAFATIGAQCFDLASEHKLLYHAAAVFATNFLPVLQSVAEDAWRRAGVPAQLLPGLRATLLHNAVTNITTLGPTAALTGPAARGDTDAITHQSLSVTAWDPLAGAAYDALSALALRLAGHAGGTSMPSTPSSEP
jgi:predicted short-subunit dehydrogenase-like oxidoreductase (DUF2520 family)